MDYATQLSQAERIGQLAAAWEAGERSGPKAFLAARARQRSDDRARRLGVDPDAYARGDMIHLDRTLARFDQYLDDTADDRFRRMWIDPLHVPSARIGEAA